MTQPRVDNKWVEKTCPICGKDVAGPSEIHIAGSICRGHTVEEIKTVITQTQQETLEWCLDVTRCNKDVTKIEQIIKKKMEEGK